MYFYTNTITLAFSLWLEKYKYYKAKNFRLITKV